MKNQLVTIGIVALLVCVGLSGCNGSLSDKDKFVGTWSGTRRTADSQQTYSQVDITIIFYSDGAVSWHELDETSRTGTYKIIDGKLHTYILDFETVYDVTFTNNYKSLSLVFRVPPEYGDMADFITLDKQSTEAQIDGQNNEPIDNEQNITIADQEKFLARWYGRAVLPYKIIEQLDYNGKEIIIIFYSSGYISFNNMSGFEVFEKYRVEGDKLYVDYVEPELALTPDIFGYSFTDDYKSLVLILLNPETELDEGYTIYLDRQSNLSLEPQILENVSYSYLDTWVNIDGIIKNAGDTPVYDIDIQATLYDKSGNIIKTNEEIDYDTLEYQLDFPHPGYIKPGETSYFSITFQDVPYYDHYRLEIISYEWGNLEGCGDGLVISDIKDNVGTISYDVTGTVKNEGSNKHEMVEVWGAFYDSSGNLLCVWQDYTLPLDMYSGQEEKFEIKVMDFMIDFNRISNYDLKIDSFCYS